METIQLSNGGQMPALGYGTWLSKDEELENALECALETGYRHIDTAFVYQNEHVIGKVIKNWMDSGKLTREDLFIVTKLPCIGNRPTDVEKYLDASLSKLGLDYVDLYLNHCPFGLNYKDEQTMFPSKEDGSADLDYSTDIVAVWKVMEEMVEKGKAKAIGVSNFSINQISRILEVAKIRPATNQVEYHVYCQQKDLHDYLNKEGIVLTAYSPLGTPGSAAFMNKAGLKVEFPSLMSDPVVKEIAEEVDKSPSQVLLKFVLQKGCATIPKSTNPERIGQNFQVFEFMLNPDQMSKLEALDKNQRLIRIEELFKGLENHPENPWADG